MELKENLKAGDEITIQIAPFGDYPAKTTQGEEITQHFTKEAFDGIVEEWLKRKQMIRADFDHNSEMSDNTIASGWINKLFVDDEKGLMGNLVVSKSGAEALNGLDYRFGSPVFLYEDETPIALMSFAFTNRPRLKEMSAVWNADEKIEDRIVDEVKEEIKEEVKEPITESTSDSIVEEVKEEVEEVNIDKETQTMEEIKLILGLPVEATEEDVKASITELVEKVKSIADEEITREAEEIVNECGIEDEEKKVEVINSYKQNPSLVKSVLNCMKKSPAKMVVNSEEAVKPSLTTDEKLRNEYQSLKGGQEKVDFLLNHKGIKF